MNRKWLAAAVGAGVLGVLVVFLVLAIGADDRPRATTGVDLTALGPQGSELVRLLRQGELETFHARYRATSPPGDDGGGQEVSMEVWQKPPRQRQDLLVTAGDQQGRTSGYVLGDRSVSCTQSGGEPWTCRQVDTAAGGGPDAFLRLLATEVSGGALDARDDTIAGASVRCFHFPLPASTADVCVTRRGVLARVAAGESFIELVELGSTVPDRIFSPPARVER
jgi:hypothetical protein